ncbi:glycosyltransferase family 2 protein [Wielerella bovis]|uniref:glycosyltransferase family 2 protein n=1 Tax=Wielerella bovis TaxID=2917790 RepID=UPI0020196528|nr:glycosyltransferase [Wielerella bovis]ULJ64973.1 glycosyltransferase [Wielerella bovis]ULJ67246.1 glycosyltransferase [Wielerella bovis]
MQPEITFVVPAYNVAEYLPDCLESLLAVPVAKEIILIDDGSTDNTGEVAQDFFRLHDCITLIRQHNQGVSAARNRGIALARGRFVQFVDADDILRNQAHYPDWIEFATQQKIDIVKTLIQWIKHNGEYLTTQSPYHQFNGEAYVSHGHDYWHQMLLVNWFPLATNGFYRTQLLQQHGLRFPEGISHSEDALFFADVMCSQPDIRVLEIKQVGYVYRHRVNSASHSLDSNMRGCVSTCEIVKLLWQRMEWAKQRAMQSENQAHWQRMHKHLISTIAVQVMVLYDRYYVYLNETQKASVRHYFTPELLALVQPFSKIDIVL